MHKFEFWHQNHWLTAASFGAKIQIIKLKELVLTVRQKKWCTTTLMKLPLIFQKLKKVALKVSFEAPKLHKQIFT